MAIQDENTIATTNSGTNLFLTNLRAATAAQHKKLEANPLSISLMSPDVTIASYVRYLALMGEVVSFTEKAIFPAVMDIIPDLGSRHKLLHIHDDLHTLDDKKAAINMPLFYPVDQNMSVPFALGYMYVIEGSTLGGRIILKHAQDKLNLTEKTGGSFFAGYGADTGLRWKSFLSALTKYAVATDTEKEIIHGAQHAFDAIDRYFNFSNSTV
jgi:heme oxygenase